MDQARASLDKEVDIIKLIRSRRFVHNALKHLLDPALRKELKSQSHFKEVAIDPLPGGLDEADKKKKIYSFNSQSDLSARPEANDVQMIDYQVGLGDRGVDAPQQKVFN